MGALPFGALGCGSSTDWTAVGGAAEGSDLEASAPNASAPESSMGALEPAAVAPAASPESVAEDSKYLLGSAVFGPDSTTTYLSIIDSLDIAAVDYSRALELPGWADAWVHEGYVFVSDGESPTVTRYSVAADGSLEPGPSLSFAAYGLVDAAFWSNTFVARDKAYMINGVAEYVVWDPMEMVVTGTLPLPDLPERPGLLRRAGTTDRSNVIRDGRLYQPLYWSDEDYARFSDDSRIAVFDIASDTLVDVLEAPCAGLDVGTRDAAGNLYFSTWTSGVLGPFVFEAPLNCVVSVPAGQGRAELAFRFADVTGGREGAAARELGDGKLALSVFHDERVDFGSDPDPFAFLAANNWQTWIYDPVSGTAAPNEGLGWNSGATYNYQIDGRRLMLVPGTDYGSTLVYELEGDAAARPLFDTRGWSIRLFKVR